jgi:hypothetical protein
MYISQEEDQKVKKKEIKKTENETPSLHLPSKIRIQHDFTRNFKQNHD